MRLPKARSERDELFLRKIVALLPHVFDRDEGRRYVEAIYDLLVAGHRDTSGAQTGTTQHAGTDFYIELAELLIGYVLLNPDMAKDVLIDVFVSLESQPVTRQLVLDRFHSHFAR
jgi:hypothetical protein